MVGESCLDNFWVNKRRERECLKGRVGGGEAGVGGCVAGSAATRSQAELAGWLAGDGDGTARAGAV